MRRPPLVPLAPRASILAALALAGCFSAPPAPPDTLEQRARDLAHATILVDGHIDLPYRLTRAMEDVSARTDSGDFDWPRAVEGGLDAPFLSIFVPARYEAEGGARDFADELIDLVEGLAREHPDEFALARSAADVRRLFGSGRVAFLMGMENGSPIEGDLANVDHFAARGVRYVTLCHSEDNHICDSSFDDRRTWGGLSPFGRDVVRRMNELGVLVDVSHVSDDAFWQVLEVARAPVIASHSSLRHFVPGFERNMSDEMVRAVAENDGVVMINFGSAFVTAEYNAAWRGLRDAFDAFVAESGVERRSPEAAAWRERYLQQHPLPRADVGDVADHVERVIELVGVEHVGFGSDFDGVGDSLPTGLEDVSKYPNLIAELLRRGHSEADLEKICSGNVLRVMEEAERVAAELGG